MKNIYFALVGLFSIFGYSQNSDGWMYIGESIRGHEVYIKDIEKAYGNSYTYWRKMVKPPIKYKDRQGKIVAKKSGYSVTYTKIYCDSKTYSTFDYIDYNSKDEVIDSGDYNDTGGKIAPDTIIEGIYIYLCTE